MGLLRVIFGLVRLLVASALVAVFILFGMIYLDRDGELMPKLRAAAEGTVSPQVVSVVGLHGSEVSNDVADFLSVLMTRAHGLLEKVQPESVRLPSRAPTPEQVEQSHHVLKLINDYRASNGAHSLQWNDRLAAFAQERANDMMERDYFSHHDPMSGEMLLARLHTFVTVGENLYQIAGPAVPFMRDVSQQAVNGWRNSPSHNELMLDGRMDTGGIGIARSGARIVVVLVASR